MRSAGPLRQENRRPANWPSAERSALRINSQLVGPNVGLHTEALYPDRLQQNHAILGSGCLGSDPEQARMADRHMARRVRAFERAFWTYLSKHSWASEK